VNDLTPAGRPATPEPRDEPNTVRLRLYVAGDAPNSRRALATLQQLCSELPIPCEVEIVDVLEAPSQAAADGVLLTPMLVKLAPPPGWKLVGNLDDPARVRAALDLPDGPDGKGA
jgi:circadian clock protein KaiB